MTISCYNYVNRNARDAETSGRLTKTQEGALMYKIITGIYAIVNKTNGHRYIGSSTSIKNRWGVHRFYLRTNTHHSRYLQNAWNKYSEAGFEFIIIETCDRSNLLQREQYYIDLLKPEYNVCGIAGETRGVPLSEETHRKMREARALRVTKESTRAKLSAVSKGLKRTAETRAKMGAAQIGNKKGVGRVVTQEARAKTRATWHRNNDPTEDK